MCILFLAINRHSDYPVVICANRDEFYARPTSAAHFWEDHPTMLAGKDLQAGGSWLGVSKQGKFAAITNIRTGATMSQKMKSRGELVTFALMENSPISSEWLEENSDHYSPFNLIYGPLDRLICFNSESKRHTILNDGFHAVSNGELDDVWPKMAKGEKQLEAVIRSNETLEKEQLFSILRDQEKAKDGLLPDTGVPIEWERLLSSIFICSDGYGTRSSCLLLQKNDQSIEFVERQYNECGDSVGQQSFEL